MTRALRPLVVGALAAVALAGCSGSGSGGSSSATPTTSISAPSSASSSSASSSASSAASNLSSSASSAAGQLKAVTTCLKNANLPTPTSTNPADFAQEVVKLVRDPDTRAALQKCGIKLPGLS